MNRRETVLGLIAFGVAPVIAHAQSSATPRLGVMFQRKRTSKDMQAFLAELQRLGYEEGKTLRLDYLEGPVDKYPVMAAELVRRNVDVIYAPNTAGAVAARKATQTIPIVFATAHDPVETGLVQSLPKPAWNVTGLTVFASDLPGKRLQLLKELVPRLTRVAVLRSPLNDQTRPAWNALAGDAKTVSLTLQPFDVSIPEDFTTAFHAIRSSSCQALLIHDDAFTSSYWPRIAALAIEARLPSNSTWDQATEAGILFSYGPNIIYNYRRAAGYVVAILKGTKPAQLPVEQPTKFDLVVNLKTAKAINLSVPQSFLMRVDGTIEG